MKNNQDYVNVPSRHNSDDQNIGCVFELWVNYDWSAMESWSPVSGDWAERWWYRGMSCLRSHTNRARGWKLSRLVFNSFRLQGDGILNQTTLLNTPVWMLFGNKETVAGSSGWLWRRPSPISLRNRGVPRETHSDGGATGELWEHGWYRHQHGRPQWVGVPHFTHLRGGAWSKPSHQSCDVTKFGTAPWAPDQAWGVFSLYTTYTDC